MLKSTFICALVCLLAAACTPSTGSSGKSVAAAIQEVQDRDIRFPEYPQSGRTYLSFSHAHGFQVNYIAQASKAWLWYPGNGRSLPETYKLDRVSGQAAICWQHPNNSYNPVTGQNGGSFACEPLAFASKAVVSELSGDVFDLASGQVPYRLDRCKAPDQFDFDRVKFGC